MSRPVVIVDDSLTVRMDLGDAFREAGLESVLCASLTHAREEIGRSSPALVVLDIVLPDGDGIELLRQLRQDPETRETPVMLLSSEAEVRDRIRGLSMGASEYVGKPYDARYVVARARELIPGEDEGDAPSVLVIDDSLTYREEISETLGKAGYRPVLARSGEEGLRRAAELRPDAIIVDGVMPGMSGTAVIQRIRLDPGLNNTPCLLLTASDGAGGEVAALDSGADAYVRKSEETEVILARLGGILRAATDSRDASSTSSVMGPKRILAVDDSVTFIEELAEMLRSDGYEVVKATTGEEALELLAVERIDAILLDRRLPGLSGTEVCRRVKSSPSLRHVPLIMLTSLEDPESLIEGMNAGADDYVGKSAGSDVIKARLRAQIRRKQFEDENRQVRDELLKREAETRAAREQAEERAALLRSLEEKNQHLEVLNAELESFAYAVSHDLGQPVRSIGGFTGVLLEEYPDVLDARGQHYLRRVRAGAQRMEQMIQGLLLLSRVVQRPLRCVPLRLDVLAWRVIERLRDGSPGREVEASVAEPIEALGDETLVESALENLIGNAWKYTAEREHPRIGVGVRMHDDGTCIYAVSDNGAGFDMRYADKLFAPFQRLHSDGEFTGSGIGLATTQRIVKRHGGVIWAESEPGQGATFFFTLSPYSPGRCK